MMFVEYECGCTTEMYYSNNNFGTVQIWCPRHKEQVEEWQKRQMIGE